jgi:hypothetical protein
VGKLSSQGGEPTAYLTKLSTGGATVGSRHYLYLTSGSSDQVGKPIVEAVNSCDLKLEWKDRDVLLVNYNGMQCNILRFKNYWYDPVVVEAGGRAKRIEIILVRQPGFTP